jgi:hypothetical protein
VTESEDLSLKCQARGKLKSKVEMSETSTPFIGLKASNRIL